MAQAERTASSNSNSDTPDYSALSKDVEQLKGDIKNLTNTLEQVVRANVNQGRHEAANQYEAAKRQAEELRGQVQGKMQESVTEARTTVANHPLASLGAALGAGIVLGMMMRRH